jgi:Arc/MetJ family transcription regulator
MEVAGDKTKTEIVNEALRSFARARRRRQLLDLRGKARWEGNIDRLRKRS